MVKGEIAAFSMTGSYAADTVQGVGRFIKVKTELAFDTHKRH
jgi:hypothetical protein